MVGGLLWKIMVINVLLIAPLQTQPPEPAFNHDARTVWMIDPTTGEQITLFSIDDYPPYAVDTLSTQETQILHTLLETSTPHTNPEFLSPAIIDAALSDQGDLMILLIHDWCSPFATGSIPCAGYTEIIRVEANGTPPIPLFRLDYHYIPAMEGMDCWRGYFPEPLALYPSPDHSKAILMLGYMHHQCDEYNRWGILIDLKSQTMIDLPHAKSAFWSPNGQYFAYIDMSTCRDDPPFCPERIIVSDGEQQRTLPDYENYAEVYDRLRWSSDDSLTGYQITHPIPWSGSYAPPPLYRFLYNAQTGYFQRMLIPAMLRL